MTDLVAAPPKEFYETLDDACQQTALHLDLTAPVVTHSVADMVRNVQFATHSGNSLTTGLNIFLFVARMAEAAEVLRTKA